MAHVHRARHPSVWSPSRQPSRPVEIDWTHPLAAGLVGYWLFTGPLPVGARNLVSGMPLPLNGNPPVPVVDCGGRALRFNGFTGGLVTEPLGDPGGIPYTFAICLQRFSESTASTGISGIRTNGVLRHFFLIGADHTPAYLANYGSSAQINSPNPLALNQQHTLLGTTRTTTDHEFYVDGASQGVSATSCGTNPGQRNQIILGQTGSNNGRELYYYWAAAWARDFSAADAAALQAAPYSFLKPAG